MTVSDFLDVARRTQGLYSGPAEVAKRQLLEDLLKRSLLLEAGQRKKLVIDSLVRQYRATVENEILSAAMVEHLVPRSVPVSDDEARQLYDWRREEARLQVIFTLDRKLADAAFVELGRGLDFTAVANRFNLSGQIPTGGDLGFMASGMLPSPLDEYLREAPLGKVIGPVSAGQTGWFIAQVLERRPHAQGTFEEERPALANLLGQRKRRALSVRAFEHLRDGYRLRVEPDGPQLLFSRYNRPAAAVEADDFSQLAPEARNFKTVLARYEGLSGADTTYTLGDAIHDIESGNGERPDPTMLPSFEQWIQSRVVQRIVVIDARRRRLDQEPAVAKRIHDRVESYVLDSIYEAEVAASATVTEQDVHQAYQREAAALSRLEAVHVQHITVPDSGSAALLAERVKGAKSLGDAILLASPNLQVRDEVVRFPSQDPVWSQIEGFLRQMAPGAYAGPIPAPGGWRVIQLVSADRTTPTLAELPEDTQRMLRTEAENSARERRLSAYTDSLRRTLGVVIDATRLKRIPWPVPTQATPG